MLIRTENQYCYGLSILEAHIHRLKESYQEKLKDFIRFKPVF